MQFSIGRSCATLLAAVLWAAGTVVVANRDFVVVPNGNDYYNGGDGSDTVSFERQYVPVLVDLARGWAEGEGIGTDTLVSLENVTAGRAGDTVYGNEDDNVLRGMNGNDELFGAAGRDVLEGGRGDDLLGGGSGDDQYVFGPGDGKDHIFEPPAEGSEDVLVLDADRAAITLHRWGDALLVHVASGDTRDLIVVWDQFHRAAGSGIERIDLRDESLDLSVLGHDVAERFSITCLLSWPGDDCPARPEPSFSDDQT